MRRCGGGHARWWCQLRIEEIMDSRSTLVCHEVEVGWKEDGRKMRKMR